MLRRSRRRRPFAARLRSVVGGLVALGYLAGLGASTAGRGLALGAHVAAEHSTQATPPRERARRDTPAAAAQPHAHDHAGASSLDAKPTRHGHAEHQHAERGSHRHATTTELAAEAAAAEAAAAEAERPATGDHSAEHPAESAANAAHEHGGRAHRHDVPEPPPGAPPPVALDKYRLPERPAIPPPPTSGGIVSPPADVWASAEGTVETPPPRARG